MKLRLEVLILLFYAAHLISCTRSVKENMPEAHVDTVSESSDGGDTLNRFKQAEEFDYNNYLLEERIPPEVRDVLSKYLREYRVYFELNPFYLRGDFNGDGVSDLAIVIEHVSSGRRGILLVHAGTNETFLIGAGNDLWREGNVKTSVGDDMKWLHIWYVYPKKSVEVGVGEDKSLTLLGDAIYAEKAEAASGLIYWNGRGYFYYQQGD